MTSGGNGTDRSGQGGRLLPALVLAGLLISVLACVLGTLVHPARTPGTDPDPVTFWDSRETLSQGLGEKWYSSVVFWAGLSLVLTLAGMVIFSQLFFPTGAGP